MREWVIYAAIMVVVFILFFRDEGMIGAIAGLLVSGPLYLLLGAVLAKFGYQRRRLGEGRGDRKGGGSDASEGSSSEGGAPRPKPAPTRRTSTGPQRPASKSKRRR
jgi:hypothetical protein